VRLFVLWGVNIEVLAGVLQRHLRLPLAAIAAPCVVMCSTLTVVAEGPDDLTTYTMSACMLGRSRGCCGLLSCVTELGSRKFRSMCVRVNESLDDVCRVEHKKSS
jgi:hypothetical protein